MTESKDKKIIGFDLDGVIIDHSRTKVVLAGKYGWNISIEQSPSDILKNILPSEIYENFQNNLYDDSDIAFMSPLSAGAENTLKFLKDEKFPYFLISRRKKPEVAIELIKRYGLWPIFFHENNVFFVGKKSEKNLKAVEMGITHYLDDEVSVLKKLSGVRHRFLFDQFDVFPDSDFYVRVKSWKEFINHLLHHD